MAWLLDHLCKEPLMTIEKGALADMCRDDAVAAGAVSAAASAQSLCAVSECEQVASFTWRGTKQHPLVVVPGQPRALTEWAGGMLTPDTGTLVIDYNHHFCPSSPTEPVLRALLV